MNKKKNKSKKKYSPPKIKKLNTPNGELPIGKAQPPGGTPPSLPGPSGQSPSVPQATVF